MVFIAVAVIPSCNIRYFENPEFGDIIFDSSLAIPVGEITYTVSELFEELNDAGATIGTNTENVVTLTYQEELQSQSASGFLEVLDQNFSASVQSGTTINNPPVTVVVASVELFEFDLSQTADEAYDSLFFNGGNMAFTVNSDINADIAYTATFLSLEEGGAPIVFAGNLSAGSSGVVENRQLAGVKGKFDVDAAGDPARSKFLIRVEYNATITPSSSIAATDQLSFNIGITNTTFDRVYGSVGNQSLDVGQQTIDLGFFDNFDTGEIRFADPKVRFVFDNSFGFPIGIDFQQISSVSSDGSSTTLQGDVVNSLQVVNAPTINQEGQTIRTEIELNAQNSNIEDFLTSQTRQVVMNVSAESNPSNTPQVYNFINDENLLDVFVEVEIPLDVNMNGLAVEESVNFTNGDDLQEAKQLLFRIIAENELPLAGLVELQFLDAQANVIFTVDQRAAFSAAPVGADGRTTEAVMSTTDVTLTDSEIRIIENATSINVVATLTTTDAQQGGSVKFFDDYELKFRLAAQADVEINSNGN